MTSTVQYSREDDYVSGFEFGVIPSLCEQSEQVSHVIKGRDYEDLVNVAYRPCSVEFVS